MGERIVDVNTLKQYKEDYKLYAIYTCRERVMADVRDGLKPVARKILVSGMDLNLRFPKIAKSARIVGETMGKYHPHGDSSIYGTMKPMSNTFEIKQPLLNQGGAWGNKYGDEPSAMRYTESGLSEFAMDALLKDIISYPNCVDWMPNFDDTIREPESLPAALPILLVNGSFGIGVGLKIEIPKHNLADVIDETIKVIKDRTAPVRLVPDQCMGCEIIDTDFEDIGNKGYGYFTVRGIIEEDVSPTGNPTLIIKSAPDLVYYETIDNAITAMIANKKLVNVVSTNHQGTEFIIEVRKGTDLNYIKQMLYQHTDLQKNCRVSFEVLDKDGPMRMSYKAYILGWLEYRKFTKIRIYYAELQDVNTEMHKLEPYIKLARSPKMDAILKKINKFKGTDEDLIEWLIKELDITDLQSEFIINLRMRNITAAALAKYVARYDELAIMRESILDKLTIDDLIEADIIEELTAIKAKYGRKRICKIISKSEAVGIPQGEFKVIVTENNCLKKLPVNESNGTFKNDKPKYIIKGDNTQNLIIFTEMAKVFKIPIHKIGFSDKRSNGIDIKLLLKNCTSNINAIMYEPVLESFMNKISKYFIVTLTNNGYIKKMDIDDFLSANSSGLVYAKLDEDDFIKDIMIINHKSDVIVYTANKALRFSMDEVPYLKRSTKGNKALGNDESIMGVSVVTNDVTDVVVVSKKGYVNRIPVVGLPRSTRAKAPGRVIKLGKGDYIIGLYGLNANDIVNVFTTEGRIDINVADVPVGSTVSPGTKMIKTRGEEILYSYYQKQ